MVSIGPRIQITGESAYRAALSRIISETKSLNTEMDLMVAKFTKSETAIEKNKQKQEMLTRQIEQSKTQYDKFAEGLSKATKKQEEITKAYDENQKKLEKLKQEKEHTRQVIEKLTEEFGENSKYVEAAKKHYDELEEEIKDTSKESERLAENIDRAGKVTADWQTKTNQAELELVNLKNELRDLPSQFQLVGESMQRAGEAMKDVGNAMTMYITTPLVAAGTAFVKWSSDFTDGMAKIYTIADESKKPMSEMREELIQLSNASGYSLEDLAEAEYQAVSASVDTSKAVAFLTDATRLARGGFTSTTQAVDLLTTVINAYGYQAEDAAYISDVLLRTQNDGKTVVDELAHSMGTVIPTAANYNVSLEQLAAAYATMTKQGVNTSRATTFLNAMFTELEKGSSAIAKTLDKETGKSFAQLMGEGKSLAEVLDILYKSVDEDNEQFQKLFGNIRSGKAASALLTDDFGILNYEVNRMNDALGQTDHAMEVLETPSLKVKRAIQQLKNSGMELGTTLINTLAPGFEKVINAIKVATDYFSGLSTTSMNMILAFAGIVAATGPLLSILGNLATTVGGIIAGISAGTLPLTTTIGLVVGLAEVLGALFVAGEVMAEQHRQEIEDLWKLDDEYQKLVDTSHQLNDEYQQSKEAIQQKEEANLAEIGYAESLIDRYNELIDSNGEVRKGYEHLADVLLNELAEALGISVEQVKELIEENGKFGSSIDETIEKMKERAKMAAAEEILTEAYRRMYDAQKEIEKMESALVDKHADVTEAEWKLKQATDERDYALEHGIDVTQEQAQALIDAQTAYDTAVAAEEELQKQYEETVGVRDECINDIARANDLLVTDESQTMAEMADAIKNGGNKVVNEATGVARRTGSAFSIDGDGIGYYIDSGVAAGIDRYSYLVSRSAAQLAYEANHSLRGALSIQSPSKVTAEAGKYFSEGFAIGIEEQMKNAQQAANMLANSAVGGLQMTGYEPTTSYRVSAPITITLNVEGNVDGDDRAFTRNIAEELANLITRESEVFA